MENKKLEEKIKEIRIDPDVPWDEEHNLDSAKKLDIIYDKKIKVYRDKEGCPVLDKYGQYLG